MKNKFFIILIAILCAGFLLTPSFVVAQPVPRTRPATVPLCEYLIRDIRNDLISECRDADLSDPTESDYCERINLNTEQQLCAFANLQKDFCVPRQGAVGLLCERAQRANQCTGACPETSSDFRTAPVEDIKFEPTLPRLQIDIPGLQPFTKASLKTTIEGDTVMLDVNFIGPYLVGLYKYLVSIAGIVAGIIIVWAGVKWLTSAGKPEGISEAKKKIAGAVVGLILVLGSYIILQILNPELVIFKPLRVEYIKQELLDVFDGKDLETETITPAFNISDTRYDAIFQKFANCVPADWRLLKAIAYKESGLDTNKRRPGSHYVGLFQTNQANCEGVLQQYSNLQSYCSNLTNPSVNTAVGALMMKSAILKIQKKCPDAGIVEKLTMIYINHNMGPAVLNSAVDIGCSLDQLKQGCINYYNTNKRGQATARNYTRVYRQDCLQSKTTAECTAGPKFDYALSVARATQGLGVSQISTTTTGVCPLDTLDPFSS